MRQPLSHYELARNLLDRLGFPPERLAELNPRLVTLSISGFGHDGPEGGRPGYDQIAQGEAGLMSLTGSGPDDPQRVGVPIGDLLEPTDRDGYGGPDSAVMVYSQCLSLLGYVDLLCDGVPTEDTPTDLVMPLAR